MQNVDVVLDRNYFEIFNLTPAFIVPLDTLAERFKALQSQVHPDRYANASSAEKRLSVQRSSVINQAYQTLRNPLERAKYLLQLNGLESSQQSATVRDPEFLLQQMELRENLEQITQQSDPITALMRMEDDIASQIKKIYQQLEQLFPRQAQSESDLAQAAESVNRLQFLHKLRSEIIDKQQQLM